MEHFRLIVEIAIGITALVAFGKLVLQPVRIQAQRVAVIEEGIQSMLHDRIYQALFISNAAG